MYRFAASGLVVAVCAAIGFADSTAPQPPSKSKSAAKAATPQRPSIIIAPLSPDVLAEAVKEEQKACTRRLDACAKLREIAAAKNNDALLQQIDDLEKQAVEICQARVARLGVRSTATRRSVPTTEPAFDAAKVAPPVAIDNGGGK